MASKRSTQMVTMLSDKNVALEQKIGLLHQLAIMDGQRFTDAAKGVLERAAEADGESVFREKVEALSRLMEQIEAGPLRYATFHHMTDPNGHAAQAQVSLQDGTIAFLPLAEPALADTLRRGDTVLIDGSAKVVLRRGPDYTAATESARLERRVDDLRVEVSVRDHEPHVLYVSERLRDRLDAGDVKPGARLIVCTRRGMAFDAIPTAMGLSHYRFLSHDPVPDVDVHRDVGSPPAFLSELAEHVRCELTDSALSRRLRINRFVTRLLTGPSGTGKTLSILAFIRIIYDIMSEVTATAIDALPSRVMWLRSSQVLSRWLGDSDKNLDRFFDELNQLAAEKFLDADGHTHELPLIVVFEEADALGRRRGEDGVYDRIQTTFLRRLDGTFKALRDRLVICLFSSNLPNVLDPAFLRRIGGQVVQFGRLDRLGFSSVLSRQLQERLLDKGDEEDESQVRTRMVSQLAAWIYAPNADRGQVELSLAGQTAPTVKYRRDFMTGGLIDRAVQQACLEVRRAARNGAKRIGLSVEMLATALHQQVRQLVDTLDTHNVHQYVDLPDGVRVTAIRRIDQTAINPFEMERNHD